MDQEQEAKYGSLIEKWKSAAEKYGTGWDEDAPEIPVDYVIDVDMVDYYVGGLFKLFDGNTAHLFTTPQCDIMASVTKVKAHMNRMISAVEFAKRDLAKDDPGNAIPVWDFVKGAAEYLCGAHHGCHFRIVANSRITTTLFAHATGIPSTLPWDIRVGYDMREPNQECEGDERTFERRYIFGIRTTVFTVCPFVLHETCGKQSHTQRSHIDITIEADRPVLAAPIMREICRRLVPVMSNMKIPDEVVQVLKAYSGPTFTEDACVRVMKILRGITQEMVPDGRIYDCKVQVISEDSHLAHDIVSTLRNDLA